MSYKDQIMQFVHENGGTITVRQLLSLGISRGHLKALVDAGRLARVSRGVYVLPSVWEDEMLAFQERYKRGVFSHGTALFLHHLTDRTPVRYSMTFPSHYNVTNPKSNNIVCHHATDLTYPVGMVSVRTPAGNAVMAYDVERTLCDLLRPRSGVDIELTTSAFKQYAASNGKNIPLLSEYGKLLRVETKLRAYMEVLL